MSGDPQRDQRTREFVREHTTPRVHEFRSRPKVFDGQMAFTWVAKNGERQVCCPACLTGTP